MKYRISPISEIGQMYVTEIQQESSIQNFQLTFEFLGQHSNRFKDQSIVIFEDNNPIAYVLAADSPDHKECVESHPGAAFGGLVTKPNVKGLETVELLEAALNYYKDLGFKQLIYRATPYIYSQHSLGDLNYAIHRNRGYISQSLLSCAIDFRNEVVYSKRKSRSLKKNDSQLRAVVETGLIEEYWDLLESNLWERHKAKPLHSVDSIKWLINTLPSNIELWVCLAEDSSILAGVLVFKNRFTWKSQYIAANKLGRSVGALDFLFNEIIISAKREGMRYFDFGTSNEDNGDYLNTGLYDFKTEFGAKGVSYEKFKFDLVKNAE